MIQSSVRAYICVLSVLSRCVGLCVHIKEKFRNLYGSVCVCLEKTKPHSVVSASEPQSGYDYTSSPLVVILTNFQFAHEVAFSVTKT